MNTGEIKKSLKLLSEDAFTALRQVRPKVQEATVANIIKAKKRRGIIDRAKLLAAQIAKLESEFKQVEKQLSEDSLYISKDGVVSLDYHKEAEVERHLHRIRMDIERRIDAFYIALPRLSTEQRRVEFEKIVEFIGERTPTEDTKVVGLEA